jgi:hypothetical protein
MSFAQPVLIMLCVLASLTCMGLLFRGWRRSGSTLLFWSALCFVALALNNLLVLIDIVVLPTLVDLRPYRLLASLCAVAVLIWGFITEAE